MNNTAWALEYMKGWTEDHFDKLQDIMCDFEGSRVIDVTHNRATGLIVVKKLGGYSYSFYFHKGTFQPHCGFWTCIVHDDVSWCVPTLLIMEQLNEDILRYARDHFGFGDELKDWRLCIEQMLKEISK